MSDSGWRLRRTSDDALLCERLVLAESFLQRLSGLMGRAAIGEGEGLYLSDSSIHMMFMRFPIDALFVSEADPAGRRQVVALRPDLPPWRGLVLPVRGAEGVIEMPAGTMARFSVAAGDEMVMEPTPVEGVVELEVSAE